ncbi:c-type cytochrome [Methylothermus subterraneus]
MKTILTLMAAIWLLMGARSGAAQPAKAQEKAAVCVGCHGEAGKGVTPLFPKLAGQNPKYLSAQLRAFKHQSRSVPAMNAVAAGLSEEDIATLSAYFAAQLPQAEAVESSPEGEAIYRFGIAARKVPACAACHGPQGQGNAPAGFPRVQGQYAAYTIKALSDYAQGLRGENTPMRAIAARLNEAEMKAVAAYIAGLK